MAGYIIHNRPLKRNFCAILGPLLLLLCYLCQPANAQEALINLGEAQIGLNQQFKITIQATNGEIKNYSTFPDIKGFSKSGTSSGSTTQEDAGIKTTVNTLVQGYTPQREGKFILPPFIIAVNGKEVKCGGTTITVTPPVNISLSAADVEEELEEEPEISQAPTNESAFLSLRVSRRKVYAGQGFNVYLSFYLAADGAEELQFYEVGEQVQEILKKLKPANCWEENFGIDDIQPRPLKIGNKRYTEFRMYQASFYPLNGDAINFPQVKLKMARVKPGSQNQEKLTDLKEFFTVAAQVQVIPLPPHPLKDVVPVGEYRLQEEINKLKLKTGQNLVYSFTIAGTGNTGTLINPDVVLPDDFETYPPAITQSITRSNNRVYGWHSYKYNIVPTKPGRYDLGKYFSFIYFNPARRVYDTLRSNLILNINGSPIKAGSKALNADGLYSNLDALDNTPRSLARNNDFKLYLNVLLAVIGVAGIFFFFWKRT